MTNAIMPLLTVYYSHNNSGGYDWLTVADWQNLEANGWVKDRFEGVRKDGFTTLKAGVAEWEEITGQHAGALGCECCGQPHNFYAMRADEYVDTFDEYDDPFDFDFDDDDENIIDAEFTVIS